MLVLREGEKRSQGWINESIESRKKVLERPVQYRDALRFPKTALRVVDGWFDEVIPRSPSQLARKLQKQLTQVGILSRLTNEDYRIFSTPVLQRREKSSSPLPMGHVLVCGQDEGDFLVSSSRYAAVELEERKVGRCPEQVIKGVRVRPDGHYGLDTLRNSVDRLNKVVIVG